MRIATEYRFTSTEKHFEVLFMLFEIQRIDIMTDKKKKEDSVSTDEMVRSLANIIKNGMKLGRMTEKEQSDLQVNLIDHISNSPYYTAFYDYDTKTIMVETSYFDPLICVDITHDSIYFLPLTKKNNKKRKRKKKLCLTLTFYNMKMKMFYLNRLEDESGVSGTGRVAQGFIFDNGKVALTWLLEHPSVTIYDNIGEVRAIHSHDGKTEIEMIPDFKRAFNELKSFMENFSLMENFSARAPVESAAAKLLNKN